jgi:hypothetical protein
MSGARAQFVFALLVAASVCLVAAKPVFGTERHPAQKQAVKQEPVVPQPPPQPLVPLTLEGMPAMPPEVSYRDGQLTIVAQNSTLADILRAVRGQTHASVDVPSSATERVVSHFGPGPAREVLAELLNGSHFNYVLLGSAADPAALDRVILTPKAPSGAETASPVPVNSPQPGGFPAPESPNATSDQANENDSEVQTSAQASQPAEDQPGNQSPVRTPEQMLHGLPREQWKAGHQDPGQTPPQSQAPSQ